MIIYKIIGIIFLILSVVFLILVLSCIKDAVKNTQKGYGLSRIGAFLISFFADSWELFALLFVTAFAGLIFLLK